MANIGQAVGLIVFGLFLAIIGGAGYSSCAAMPVVNGFNPDCGGWGWLIGLGAFLLVIGIVLLVVRGLRRTTVVQQVPDPSVPPPIIQPVIVQQTVERQVVKVRCPYCGNLYDVTAKACPSCGAPVT
ncbi:MAG TPA: zinc ribbon domain-containing protein [Thermoplasmata archaeon]|nr:zinc ribbon domain-containing protein [Thermoplasmata archaeon]